MTNSLECLLDAKVGAFPSKNLFFMSTQNTLDGHLAPRTAPHSESLVHGNAGNAASGALGTPGAIEEVSTTEEVARDVQAAVLSGVAGATSDNVSPRDVQGCSS